MKPLPAWPYPRCVAHRGAGKLAPENTLAAFRLGASHGYRMFECDVKLSADGIPFLMHDAEWGRSTNAAQKLGAGRDGVSDIAGEHPWNTLSQLDAGSWHSPAYAGEPLPTLEAIARYCIANGYFLNLEIKPTPGTEYHTGEVVAQHAARLRVWRSSSLFHLLFRPPQDHPEGAVQAHLGGVGVVLLPRPRLRRHQVPRGAPRRRRVDPDLGRDGRDRGL